MMRHRQRLATQLVLVALLTSTILTVEGCAAKTGPVVSPEGQIADKATIFVKDAKLIAVAVKQEVDGLLSEATRLEAAAAAAPTDQNAAVVAQVARTVAEKAKLGGIKAMQAFEQVGKKGEELANILLVVDTAKELGAREAALGKAGPILDTIKTLLTSGLVQIHNEATSGQVVTLIDAVTNLSITVQVEIEKIKAAIHGGAA